MLIRNTRTHQRRKATGGPFAFSQPILLFVLLTVRSLPTVSSDEVRKAVADGVGKQAETAPAVVLEETSNTSTTKANAEVEETTAQAKEHQEKYDGNSSGVVDTADSDNKNSYGLDVCFPIHHRVSTNYAWLPHNRDGTGATPTPPEHQNEPIQPLGNRRALYIDYLDKCRAAYPRHNSCDQQEYARLLMNQRQPQSMKNYTKVGFQKIKAPEKVVQLIQDFWKKNHYKGKQENWPYGNPYINHWESPTYLISVDDTALRGSGPELKQMIWAAASASLEVWTSEELQPVSFYGIRVYGEGSIMLPHVDRLPLVASAIVPVAQDVDEPWPFEMYDHQGRAHNITMQVGDMLLFESASVVHGHPFPLKGRFAAYIFIHFEPTGHPLRYDGAAYKYDDVKRQYLENVKKGYGGPSADVDFNENTAGLPPYLKRESPEEENWRLDHPEGWQPPETVLPPESHIYAKTGEVEKLRELLAILATDTAAKKELLSERDENGWQILHHGVTGGNQQVVELLLTKGADINARTHGGYGETPLRIAERYFGNGHAIVGYLKGMGGLSIGPEL